MQVEDNNNNKQKKKKRNKMKFGYIVVATTAAFAEAGIQRGLSSKHMDEIKNKQKSFLRQLMMNEGGGGGGGSGSCPKLKNGVSFLTLICVFFFPFSFSIRNA